MTRYDFDTPHERRGTGSIKWSRGEQDDRWLPIEPPEGELPQDSALLPMWLADMDFRTAPPVTAALRTQVDHGIFGYAAYGDAFFASAMQWMARRHGWEPAREWMLPVNGVLPSISKLIRSLTAPGDGVIVQPPVFWPLAELPALNGRRTRPNPLCLVDGRYEMDLAGLDGLAAEPATRLLILCSPHNPVGRVWTPQELGDVGEICARHGVIIVSDEVHGDLTYPPLRFVSFGSLEEYRNRAVVCTGPSKAFNLPGMQLALAIVPDDDLRGAFRAELERNNELWGANTLSATALQAAYSEGEPWLEELLRYLQRNVDRVAEFAAGRPGIDLIRPEALYLMWLDFRRLELDEAELDTQLRAAGLWLEPGTSYGPEGTGFMRMTIACPRVVLEEGLRRMERAIDSSQ